MLTCIKNESASHWTRMAIKRFKIWNTPMPIEQHSALMIELWKEKNGHAQPIIPKYPRRYKVQVADGMRWCHGCEAELPVAAFSVDRSRRGGLSNRCRDCMAKKWKKANSQTCRSCGCDCVGFTCRRCLTVQIRVRDAEYEVISAIPRLLAEADRELMRFIDSLSPRLGSAERLRLLLEKVCGTSSVI